MPEMYASVPGGMPTGWLKKISALEEQNRQRQREIQGLLERIKELEKDRSLGGPNDPFYVTERPVIDSRGYPPDAVVPIPVKRGPGRPRKHPQP